MAVNKLTTLTSLFCLMALIGYSHGAECELVRTSDVVVLVCLVWHTCQHAYHPVSKDYGMHFAHAVSAFDILSTVAIAQYLMTLLTTALRSCGRYLPYGHPLWHLCLNKQTRCSVIGCGRTNGGILT